MQEYIANALRKPALGISESNIDAMLVLASRVRVQPITHEIVVAAALGCSTVYSEDMSDGGLYDGVRVVNPFRESAMGG